MTNWICGVCDNENGELNGYCMFCEAAGKDKSYNPDKFFVRDIKIRHIEEDVMSEESKGLTGEELLNSIEANTKMTPQEKKHAKLFYHETIKVRDMDHLTLCAHIEELADIAFTARTCHGAAKAEYDRRSKAKNAENKPKGFERSVNTDETTTDAINKIKERQTRMSRSEKVRASLITTYTKSGMTVEEANAEADRLMAAGTILAKMKDKESKEIIKGEQIRSPLSQSDGFVMQKSKTELESENAPKAKPMFNPFAKKEGV